jgi:hypothetical protein
MDGRLPTFKDHRLQIPEYVLDVEAVNAQVADLEIEAKNFAAFLRGPDHMTVVASRARLRSLVISWKHDLNRFRAFYLDNSYPDCCKQAAHFAYWCGKVKPLTLSPDAYTFSCIAINEAFALHVAMYRFLGIQPDEIDDKMYRTLLRQLYYRPTDPIQLSVSLECLRDAVEGKRAAARP